MEFAVPPDHPALLGHFPGRPIVPGVLVLDHVLDAIQASHGPLPRGLRLPQVKFLQPLLPGQTAWIELSGSAPRWRFRVSRGQSLLASGEIVADIEAAP